MNRRVSPRGRRQRALRSMRRAWRACAEEQSAGPWAGVVALGAEARGRAARVEAACRCVEAALRDVTRCFRAYGALEHTLPDFDALSSASSSGAGAGTGGGGGRHPGARPRGLRKQKKRGSGTSASASLASVTSVTSEEDGGAEAERAEQAVLIVVRLLHRAISRCFPKGVKVSLREAPPGAAASASAAQSSSAAAAASAAEARKYKPSKRLLRKMLKPPPAAPPRAAAAKSGERVVRLDDLTERVLVAERSQSDVDGPKAEGAVRVVKRPATAHAMTGRREGKATAEKNTVTWNALAEQVDMNETCLTTARAKMAPARDRAEPPRLAEAESKTGADAAVLDKCFRQQPCAVWSTLVEDVDMREVYSRFNEMAAGGSDVLLPTCEIGIQAGFDEEENTMRRKRRQKSDIKVNAHLHRIQRSNKAANRKSSVSKTKNKTKGKRKVRQHEKSPKLYDSNIPVCKKKADSSPKRNIQRSTETVKSDKKYNVIAGEDMVKKVAKAVERWQVKVEESNKENLNPSKGLQVDEPTIAKSYMHDKVKDAEIQTIYVPTATPCKKTRFGDEQATKKHKHTNIKLEENILLLEEENDFRKVQNEREKATTRKAKPRVIDRPTSTRVTKAVTKASAEDTSADAIRKIAAEFAHWADSKNRQKRPEMPLQEEGDVWEDLPDGDVRKKKVKYAVAPGKAKRKPTYNTSQEIKASEEKSELRKTSKRAEYEGKPTNTDSSEMPSKVRKTNEVDDITTIWKVYEMPTSSISVIDYSPKPATNLQSQGESAGKDIKRVKKGAKNEAVEAHKRRHDGGVNIPKNVIKAKIPGETSQVEHENKHDEAVDESRNVVENSEDNNENNIPLLQAKKKDVDKTFSFNGTSSSLEIEERFLGLDDGKADISEDFPNGRPDILHEEVPVVRIEFPPEEMDTIWKTISDTPNTEMNNQLVGNVKMNLMGQTTSHYWRDEANGIDTSLSDDLSGNRSLYTVPTWQILTENIDLDDFTPSELETRAELAALMANIWQVRPETARKEKASKRVAQSESAQKDIPEEILNLNNLSVDDVSIDDYNGSWDVASKTPCNTTSAPRIYAAADIPVPETPFTWKALTEDVDLGEFYPKMAEARAELADLVADIWQVRAEISEKELNLVSVKLATDEKTKSKEAQIANGNEEQTSRISHEVGEKTDAEMAAIRRAEALAVGRELIGAIFDMSTRESGANIECPSAPKFQAQERMNQTFETIVEKTSEKSFVETYQQHNTENIEKIPSTITTQYERDNVANIDTDDIEKYMKKLKLSKTIDKLAARMATTLGVLAEDAEKEAKAMDGNKKNWEKVVGVSQLQAERARKTESKMKQKSAENQDADLSAVLPLSAEADTLLGVPQRKLLDTLAILALDQNSLDSTVVNEIIKRGLTNDTPFHQINTEIVRQNTDNVGLTRGRDNRPEEQIDSSKGEMRRTAYLQGESRKPNAASNKENIDIAMAMQVRDAILDDAIKEYTQKAQMHGTDPAKENESPASHKSQRLSALGKDDTASRASKQGKKKEAGREVLEGESVDACAVSAVVKAMKQALWPSRPSTTELSSQEVVDAMKRADEVIRRANDIERQAHDVIRAATAGRVRAVGLQGRVRQAAPPCAAAAPSTLSGRPRQARLTAAADTTTRLRACSTRAGRRAGWPRRVHVANAEAPATAPTRPRRPPGPGARLAALRRGCCAAHRHRPARVKARGAGAVARPARPTGTGLPPSASRPLATRLHPPRRLAARLALPRTEEHPRKKRRGAPSPTRHHRNAVPAPRAVAVASARSANAFAGAGNAPRRGEGRDVAVRQLEAALLTGAAVASPELLPADAFLVDDDDDDEEEEDGGEGEGDGDSDSDRPSDASDTYSDSADNSLSETSDTRASSSTSSQAGAWGAEPAALEAFRQHLERDGARLSLRPLLTCPHLHDARKAYRPRHRVAVAALGVKDTSSYGNEINVRRD
ncbi:Protein of unknown function [Gryllus bimaculatus]|nr:Protein of unknown function [Gryllus bimaculatus]